ncbi:MAG: polysaccharide biosynthesis/export family protein [Phycisphaerae bacterium]
MATSELSTWNRLSPALRRRTPDHPRSSRWCGRWFGSAFVLACGAAGCGPSQQEINAFIHYSEASVSETRYAVQPPDSIEISSPQAPEIDGEVQTIRQDGKVSLRLLGDVKVAGLTPVEIARKLELLLGRYYQHPAVNVRLAQRASKRFFVFGEVQRAGPFMSTGRDTVLSVLAEAQPTFLAWKSRIKVIHPSHEGAKRHVLTVNAEKMMKDGDLESNVMLRDGDIVYVPPTPLAWVGLRFRELLMPIQPAADTINTPGLASDNFDRYYLDRRP